MRRMGLFGLIDPIYRVPRADPKYDFARNDSRQPLEDKADVILGGRQDAVQALVSCVSCVSWFGFLLLKRIRVPRIFSCGFV